MKMYRYNGKLISEERARKLELIGNTLAEEVPEGILVDEEEVPEEIPVDEEEIEEEETVFEPTPTFGSETRQTQAQTVFVDVGRGQTVQVDVGVPFVQTLERLAEDAHYGGYFRIFLNGQEVVDPEDSPETIKAGMRIAITSYDKVG